MTMMVIFLVSCLMSFVTGLALCIPSLDVWNQWRQPMAVRPPWRA
jgi:hypothetical protein